MQTNCTKFNSKFGYLLYFTYICMYLVSMHKMNKKCKIAKTYNKLIHYKYCTYLALNDIVQKHILAVICYTEKFSYFF